MSVTLLAIATHKVLQMTSMQPLTRIAMWLAQHQLKSKTPARRLQAMKRLRASLNNAVVSLDDMITITLLDHVLTDTEMEIRREAAATLGDFRDARTLRSLSRALNDRSEEVQEMAVQGLKQLESTAAIPPLVQKLLTGSSNLQWRAALALKAVGWQPKTNNEKIYFHLALGEIKRLSLFGSEAVKPIVEMLRTGPSEKKIPAVNVLGEIADVPALKALQGLLRDADPFVRTSAIYALERASCHEATTGITYALKDSARNVRLAAAAALGTLGGETCVEPLLKLLDDRDWEIRRTTLESLGRLGDRRAVQPMARHLKDSDQEVREVTADALGRIGDDSILEKLVITLVDTHGGVRQAAARALNRINPRWETSERVQKLLPEIQAAMKNRDAGVANAAAHLFQRVNRPAPDAATAVSSAAAAAERRQKSCANMLRELLEDADVGLRLAAAEIIGRMKLADCADALRAVANDNDALVKQIAQQSLARLDSGNVTFLNHSKPAETIASPLADAFICSLLGEVLHQSECIQPDVWQKFLEYISAPAEKIGAAMSLGEFQRLEIILTDARLILSSMPDGQALVRLKTSSTKSQPSRAESTVSSSAEIKDLATDWLHRTPSGRGVLLRGIRFPDQTIVCDVDSRGLTSAALEQTYALVAEAFLWFRAQHLTADIFVWGFSRGALHCTRREDGTILGELASVRPGDTDLNGLHQQLADFQSLSAK